MIGRRAAVGLSLLCALVLCAFAAQSASAAKAVNTTAFTCVAGAGQKDFSDAHCDTKVTAGTGKFGHEAVALNETKSLDADNETTGGATNPIVLLGKALGAATEITCSSMNTNTGGSAVHNVEAEKKHTMTGNGAAEFTECSVQKPAKCDVKEPIEVNAVFEGVEGLGPGKNEMGVEFKPAEGKPFASITYINKGAESCALNGKNINVTGSAIGTSNISQTNSWTGATIVFNHAKITEAKTLLFGGETAGVQLTTTPKGASGGAHPIPITTTT